MNLINILMILFYWFFLSGVIFLSGSYVSRIYVTGPSGAEVFFPGGRNKCLGEIVSKYLFLTAVLTLLVNTIHFILHCSVMTETPLKDVFSILPAFITKTKYGRLTILKSVFLAAIVVISFVNLLQDRKWATLSGVVCSLLLLVVIGMSGHQGVKGYWNVPFFVDVLHLIAVSMWIGGIIFICFFLAAFIKNGRIEFWQNLTSLVNRFSLLATCCVIIVVISAILLSYFNIPDFEVLTGTPYGVTLLLKTILALCIIIIGGINKFSLIPAINKISAEKSPEGNMYSSRFFRLLTIEAALGSMVLLLTSILTHLSPEG